MPSKKRKRAEKPTIHPRNRYADNPPDFSLLASRYPSFSPFVFYSRDGRLGIDWTDFNATRELTRVLLHHDHSITWWIPDGQLCPAVPNRSNYIHWIEDLLATDIIEKNNSDGDKVRGFDIGTGANCIYPLLGASLLGWSFVGSDVTDVALECAQKNVESNPHISELIEIRRVDGLAPASASGIAELSSSWTEDSNQRMADITDSTKSEMTKLDDSALANIKDKLDSERLVNSKEIADLDDANDGEAWPRPLIPFAAQPNVDTCYHGPPVLLGVVREGETFDFCMCNPPFFNSMEEAGLNPRTSCGGTQVEMVCPGGERAFISRIIEDSALLKQTFRWYTSMVGKKSNLKFLMSKLRGDGVTIVKTTVFVQGQTSRWGLAWSFMPPAKKIMPSHVVEKSNLSFMLEGLQRQATAFNVLQSVESFFCHFSASCKFNPSSFTVDVSASNDHCDAILRSDVKNLDESSSLQNPANNLSFRISVFQQIPGTLLVRGSLQQRDSTLSGAFISVFQKLEEFLKHKFCREKAYLGHVNQIQRR